MPGADADNSHSVWASGSTLPSVSKVDLDSSLALRLLKNPSSRLTYFSILLRQSATYSDMGRPIPDLFLHRPVPPSVSVPGSSDANSSTEPKNRSQSESIPSPNDGSSVFSQLVTAFSKADTCLVSNLLDKVLT